jgi:tyrosyl-tRNA synthetase
LDTYLESKFEIKDVPSTLPPLTFINNYTFYKDMSVISFLRDVGAHFRLASMISRESVKQRMDGEGMSFTEFSYQIFQGYDFYRLH